MKAGVARGSSLLEVVLAMSVLSTLGFSVLIAQLSMARVQREIPWRMRALWLADCYTEARQAQARLPPEWAMDAARLPGGAWREAEPIAPTAGPSGATPIHSVEIRWGQAERGGSAASCPPGPTVSRRSCVALPFAESDGV